MIGDSVQGANLKEDIQKKLKIIHQSDCIFTVMGRKERAGDEDFIEDAMCKPYFKLLEQIYEEDIPLVKAITESDLVVKWKEQV